ncbi:RHS repeat-associated core domain-containing protein [Streptomyces sp. NBC_01622]|uniref:RHS repeat-associated core domain-containing protein n=1 Tax=Streptomyces sp. NBC_01622 TaxID=2975903 RepID=UPI0038660FB7|nr:RHS repeat-associated core domain-containing protein [Streptomyces sp. NBC_01622]
MPDRVTSSLGATYVDATDFDTVGRLSGRTYGTTATTTTTAQRSYSYDDATGTGLLSNITTITSTKGTVQNDTYTRDAAGQTTALKDNLTTQNECFTYDELNRITRAWTTEASTGCAGAFTPDLTSTTLSPYQLDYTYDGIGNLQKVTTTTSAGASVRDYVYPGYSADQSTYTAGAAQPHGVTSINTSSGTDAYSYDAAGRMKSRTESGISTDYAWNALSQLTQTTIHATGGDKSTSYLYDADGNLLERVAPTETVLYLSGQEIHKTGTASPVATRYYSDGTSTCAARVAGTGTSALTWLMSDGQNSTQLSIDTATGTSARRRYLPFGGQRTGSLSSNIDRGFLGKTEDDSTGLSVLGARAYDPTLGRFLSTDPLTSPYDPQGLNAYAYSGNNPTNFSDATGLDPGGTRGTCLYDISLPCPKKKKTTTTTTTTSSTSSDSSTPGTVDCASYGYMVKDACAGAVGKADGVVDTSANTEGLSQIPDLVSCEDGDWVCEMRNSLYRTAVISGMLGGSFGFYGLAKAGGTVPEESVWSLPASPRGFKIEEMLGGNLSNNFKTIDK